MPIKTAAISIASRKKSSEMVRVFIAEPDKDLENLAGTIFIIAEVSAKPTQAQKVLDFLIDNFNAQYYQNEKLFLRQKIEAIKIDGLFETALINTNKDLIDFLEKEKITLSPTDISATIGVLYENQLYFSSIGGHQALLLYEDENNGNYQLINIEKSSQLGDSSPSSSPLRFQKLFTSIISGTMPARAYFLFANEALAEYLFNREIIEIITKLAPLGAAQQIKNNLAKINPYLSFQGIIIKNNSYGDDDLEEKSLDNLINLEDEPSIEQAEAQTEKILAPGNNFILDKSSNALVRILNNLNPLPRIGKKIKSLFKSKSSKAPWQPETSIDQNILLAELPKKHKTRKILLIVIGICFLVLLGSFGIEKFQTKRQIFNDGLNAKKNDIDKFLSGADSDLIYNNRVAAQEKLSSAENILKTLNDKEKKYLGDEYQKLEDSYQKISDKLSLITVVKNNGAWLDLKTAKSDADPQNLVFANNQLYLGNNSSLIYTVNTGNKNVAEIGQNNFPGNPRFPIFEKGLAYFWSDSNIIAINNQNSISISIIEPNTIKEVGAIGVYNGRVYILDKNAGQVYKFSIKDNIFKTPEPRLKNPVGDIIDFAIETKGAKSYIYLLIKNGSLERFYDGTKDSLALKTVEPALTQADRLISLNNFYILDKNNKRLVVFDKSGNFVKQFKLETDGTIKDVAIDEVGKKAYILSDAKIYQLGL